MDVEKLKVVVNELLIELDYVLSSMVFEKEKGENYLRIGIYSENHFMDLEEIVSVSEKISQVLDNTVKDDTPYMLDVSSAGAERQLKISSLEKYKEQYVKVIVVQDEATPLLGYLVEVEQDSISVKVNNKGRIKNIKINKNDIKQINLAIKI